MTHSLKGAWFQVISYQVISWFQVLLFKCNLRRCIAEVLENGAKRTHHHAVGRCTLTPPDP
jgi:hypothetical protein